MIRVREKNILNLWILNVFFVIVIWFVVYIRDKYELYVS